MPMHEVASRPDHQLTTMPTPGATDHRAAALADAVELPSWRRVSQLAMEALCAVVTASVVSLALQWAINRLPVPRPSYVPTALTALVVAGLAIVAVLVGWQVRSRYRNVPGWILPAATSTVTQAFMFHGSRFYLNGTGDDQVNRLQYLGRLAASPSLADGNYLGLPPFYPATWFWLGGRFANVLGIAGWAAYKPFAIMTMAVAAALSFVLWSLVLTRRRALVLAMVTAVAGLMVDAYEPYSWLVIATIPPIAVLVVRMLTRRAWVSRRPSTAASTVLVGVLLGLAATTYTLMFAFLALVCGIAAALAIFVPRRFQLEPDPDAVTTSVWRRVAALTLQLAAIAAIAVAVALPVWFPYLWAATRMPSSGNGSARFFPETSARLPMPMLEPNLLGALSLLGLCWLVLAWRRSWVAQGLAVVVVTCYLWHVLSTLLLVFRTSLLGFTADFVLAPALACAGALGALDAVGWLARRRPHDAVSLRVGAALAAVLVLVELTQTVPDSVAPRLEGTFTSYDDRGKTALDPAATPREDEPGSWNAQLISTVNEMTHRPPPDVIILTSHWQLFVFQPYRGFQTIVQEYANPLAQYPARRAEIESWSHATDSADLSSRLAASKFAAPQVFVFFRDVDGFHVGLSYNQFPRSDTNRFVDAVFAPELFSGPGFSRRDVGPFTVIVRN